MKIKLLMLGYLLGAMQPILAFRIVSSMPRKIWFTVEGMRSSELASGGEDRRYTNLRYKKAERIGKPIDATVYESTYIHLGGGYGKYYIDLMAYPEKLRTSTDDLLFLVESEDRVKVLTKYSDSDVREQILTPGKGLYTEEELKKLNLARASAAAAESKKEGDKVDYVAELAQLQKREEELKAELTRVQARIAEINNKVRVPAKIG